MLRRLLVFALVLAFVAAACSSAPETCDEVADQTIELTQDLIDEVEAEIGELSVEDLLASLAAGEDLPSVVAFEERAEKLSEQAADLGCTQTQLEDAVTARAGELTAETPVGRLIIQGIERGGL